ncbi:hypothetical protein PAP_07490 [Palaeococcus pacificus DY20341]|uniref:Probable GTP 3',8-cyclase n=1 Tax=Palaeococcus pacificus DY20341 TaxID=1343739 RepID=A0A075LZ99_9EURY|nr:GTP 3',8-cyclase MoaA [Palaeococcus pacificus]AIF69888.1 hypothetical protein PAP_07490 [Palaeococcus pacificus DY20341]
MPLVDRFGRPLTNLRISLTEECNYNCFFCHREGQINAKKREMTPEEIEHIVRIASSLGIKKVKLTGGEPTVRRDIVEIVERIKPYTTDLSMTTNGSVMNRLAEPLKEAGLNRVNISFHSLNRKRYKQITGVDLLDRAIKGIEKASKFFHPVKLNMTIMRGLNEDEIWDMIEFAAKNKVVLQLIELEAPRELEGTEFFKTFFYPLKPVEEELEKRAVQIKERKLHRRRKYFIPTKYGIVEVEVVRSMHNTVFCANCTRLRITADGHIKTCIYRNDNLIDLLEPLRKGASDDELIELFKKSVIIREPYWK